MAVCISHENNQLESVLPSETVEIMDELYQHLVSLDLRHHSDWFIRIMIYDNVPLVFKYVTSNRAHASLPEVGDGTLRATQPSSLNDPFECAVRPGFVESCEESANSSLAESLTKIHPLSPITKDEVAKARRDFGSLFLRELVSNQLSKRFGIVSFATCPQHLLLWSHYASDCTGFVIGYDVMQLIELSKRSGSLRPVRYDEEIPRIYGYATINNENLNALLSFKNDNWSYEQEWRLIVDLRDTIGTDHCDEKGLPINLVRIPNEAVHRVYFTERTPPVAVNAIAKRLSDPNNRFNTTKPIKLIQSAIKYEFEIVPDQLTPIVFQFNITPAS